MLTKIAGEPFAGDSSYSCTDLLNRNHQRILKSMVHEIAKPNWAPAWLYVPIPLGVIVGCSGDEPGSDQA